MATGITELLDMLYEMIDEAKPVPLSSEKCFLERDKALDLMDDIRAQLPVELSEARKLIAARADYIEKTKREGEAIRQQAEAEAKRLLAADELTAKAKQMHNDMIHKAEERSRGLRRAANEYCEDVMRRTEEAISEAHTELKNARARFRSAASAQGTNPAAPQRPNIDIEADES